MSNTNVNLADGELTDLEKVLLYDTNAQDLVKSAINDLRHAIDKLRSVQSKSPTETQTNNLSFLSAIVGEYEEAVKQVEETTHLADQPTEIEKQAGITRWGRIDQLVHLKQSGG
jgi:predicted RecB family endonuclease